MQTDSDHRGLADDAPAAVNIRLRVSAAQKALIARAAKAATIDLAEFVLDASLQRAERVLAAQADSDQG